MNQQKSQLLFASFAATLVPATIGGKTVMIDANSVAQSDRTPAHGEFLGQKVDSPELAEIGESVIVWPEAGQLQAASFTQAALGALSIKFLKSKGYGVNAPV